MKILEKYNLPKLIEKETEHLNTETEHLYLYKSWICDKNLPQNKTPGADYFSGEFNKTFMEEIIPILHKYFQN